MDEVKEEAGKAMDDVMKQEKERPEVNVRYYIMEYPKIPKIEGEDKEITTTSIQVVRFSDDMEKGYLSCVEMREGKFLEVLSDAIKSEQDSGLNLIHIKADLKMFDMIRKIRQSALKDMFDIKVKTSDDDFVYMAITIKKM